MARRKRSRFYCEKCRHRIVIEIPDDMIGRAKARCRTCGHLNKTDQLRPRNPTTRAHGEIAAIDSLFESGEDIEELFEEAEPEEPEPPKRTRAKARVKSKPEEPEPKKQHDDDQEPESHLFESQCECGHPLKIRWRDGMDKFQVACKQCNRRPIFLIPGPGEDPVRDSMEVDMHKMASGIALGLSLILGISFVAMWNPGRGLFLGGDTVTTSCCVGIAATAMAAVGARQAQKSKSTNPGQRDGATATSIIAEAAGLSLMIVIIMIVGILLATLIIGAFVIWFFQLLLAVIFG